VLVDAKIGILLRLTQICVDKNDYAAGLLYCDEALDLAENHSDTLGSEDVIKLYQSAISLFECGHFIARKLEIMPRYIQYVAHIPNGLAWSLQLSHTQAAQLLEDGLIGEAFEVLQAAADLIISRVNEAAAIDMAQTIIIKYANILFESRQYDEAEHYFKKALSLEKNA